MALIECPECGKKISEYAEMCIGCGCPMSTIERIQGTYVRKGMGRLLSKVFEEKDYFNSNKGFPAQEYFPRFNDILTTLTPKEERVLKGLSGLRGGQIYTYRELATEYNVSEERIHQIEDKAIRKMQHPSRRTFLDIMWEYPILEELKLEAKKRGYLVWAEDGVPYSAYEHGFGDACFDLLNMYDPLLEKRAMESIDMLDLSVRAYSCIVRAGIQTIGEVMKLSRAELYDIQDIEEESVCEIIEKLSEKGLSLQKEDL